SGGIFRIIDFPLSNAINSGLRRIYVISQYKAASLTRHVGKAWSHLSRELGEFVEVLHPEQRIGEQWFSGTADAVYQNIYTLEQRESEHMLILAGDHIYKMNYAPMVRQHVQSGADCTIGCIPVPLDEGRRFGVMEIDDERHVKRFEEKPDQPFPMPGNAELCLASMGIYVFRTKLLLGMLCDDAVKSSSSHDFGKDLIPQLIKTHRVMAYPFEDRNSADSPYWRDVGTIDAFFEANMDLIEVEPKLNMYDKTWPIYSYQPQLPPPKFVFADAESKPPRVGHALDSIVCGGTILSGAEVNRCIVSQNCRFRSYTKAEESIFFEGVNVGRNASIRRTIVDKFATIPDDTRIGYDPEFDRARRLTVTPSGITVVPKGMTVRDPA
ncbi:MAG: glucose-1-phosphate adenylyltransferase, partial [Planctomycetaceae bacterium]|nr:glucose-1-phosphate adenylyltransferase [Planctomycetaceae bacterium]